MGLSSKQQQHSENHQLRLRALEQRRDREELGAEHVVGIAVGVILFCVIIIVVPILLKRYLQSLTDNVAWRINNQDRNRRHTANPIQFPRTSTGNKKKDIDRFLVIKKVGDGEHSETSQDTDEENVTTANSSSTTSEQFDATHACSICLEKFETGEEVAMASVFPCQHVFHHKCIVQWLQTHRKCPCCRGSVLPTGQEEGDHQQGR